MKIELKPIKNIPLVKVNDNIGNFIIENDNDIHDDDIYIIASTIVAKSQGRMFKLKDIIPSNRAIEISHKNGKEPRLIQAVLNESENILIEDPFLLVKTKNGNICINAGIDGSNVEQENFIYLPKNPDNEAMKIGKLIKEKCNKDVSVIITDTNGRPFRNGQVSVAIGVYGIDPIMSWIGKKDLYDHTLKVSEEAIVDEIASASNLLMGEGNNGFPIIKLRGLHIYTEKNTSIMSLYRNESRDIISNLLLSK